MSAHSNPYRSLDPAAMRAAEPGSVRRHFFSTAVGTKVLIATTGLLLFLYLILHLGGNVLLFFGPLEFNAWAHFLIRNPLIIPVEIGLTAVFIIHIYKTIVNYVVNKAARPVPYYQETKRLFGYGWGGKPSRKSISSVTMLLSGLLTIFFVIIHIRHFKFGVEYLVPNTDVRDLYKLVYELFSSGGIVAFYVFSMVVVGSHLWHGLSSALNSLGVDAPGLTPWILKVGRVVAVIISGGFMILPVWVYVAGSR